MIVITCVCFIHYVIKYAILLCFFMQYFCCCYLQFFLSLKLRKKAVSPHQQKKTLSFEQFNFSFIYSCRMVMVICEWKREKKLLFLFISTYQYKYGFSRSMFTELIGSSRNHVVNVKPFSYGHFASGGNTIACISNGKWRKIKNRKEKHR